MNDLYISNYCELLDNIIIYFLSWKNKLMIYFICYGEVIKERKRELCDAYLKKKEYNKNNQLKINVHCFPKRNSLSKLHFLFFSDGRQVFCKEPHTRLFRTLSLREASIRRLINHDTSGTYGWGVAGKNISGYTLGLAWIRKQHLINLTMEFVLEK